MAILPFRRPVPAPRLRHVLLFPAICLAAGAVGCSSLPAPRSVPATDAAPPPPGLSVPAAEPPAPSKSAASQGELRLTLAAGRYVRLAILFTPGDLVVRHQGPDATPLEELRISGEGIEPIRLSWLIQVAGEYRWTVMPREPASTSGFAIWLEEERPAEPCDDARGRAERALLGGLRELSQPGEAAAARAAGLLASALTGSYEPGETRSWVATLLAAAEAERRMARAATGRELCDRALMLARGMSDRQAEARALTERALFLRSTEQLDSLNSALTLLQPLEDEVGVAKTLFWLGVFHNEHGEGGLALDRLREALYLQERNLNMRDAAGTLREIGVAYRLQGDSVHARLYLDLGLEFSLAAGDLLAEAMARHQSADLFLQNSELQAAYDQYTLAHKLLVTVEERAEAAWALVGVADCLLHLGEPDKARDGYLEALSTFEALQDQQGRAPALLGIGAALEMNGNLVGALASFQQALAVIRKAGLHGWEAVALYDLGKAYRELDQPAQAIPELDQALELEVNPARRAQILVELGQAQGKRGDLEASERAFKMAISHATGGHLVEAAAQAGLARIERERGNLAAAQSAIAKALDITEQVRSKVIREDQRISFLASRRAYFDFEVDLLMRLDRLRPGAGYDAAALAASEQARARSLLDLLVEDRFDVRQGISSERKEKRLELSERIAQLQTQMRSALPTGRGAKTTQLLEKELIAAEEEEKSLDAEIRHHQATDAAFRASVPLSLPEVQSLLDEGTALLEFFLGSEGSYLFVVTRQAFTTHPLPAQRALKPLVESLHSAVSQQSRLGSRHFADDAFRLYSLLLLPAAGDFGGKQRLILVPDGFLYSMSFEVLLTEPVPGAGSPERGLPYLVRKLSVSYVPSASVLAHLLTERLRVPEDRAGGKLFVGFADPRNKRAGESPSEGGCGPAAARGPSRDGVVRASIPEGLDHLPSLPSARSEVCDIASLFPPADAVAFIGTEATEENVKGSKVVPVAVNLHFAVHGQLDEVHPDRSGLELAHSGAVEDGVLQVREIMNLDLHADLVVLSACASGLGREVSGEGLIGMTRAFLYAGAARLVVSLWRVDDDSTAELMVRFYDHLRQTADRSEALRRAKLDLLEGDYYGPYYWAPFVLVGPR